MAAREEQQRTRRTTEEDAPAETTDLKERKEKLDEDVDSVLDEIDEVLETNSEEFVRGFVQKGGQ